MKNIIFDINNTLGHTAGYGSTYLINVENANVSIVFWGGIFSLIACLVMIFSRNFDKRKRIWMILMQFTTTVLLISDVVAIVSRGLNSTTGYWMVHISNALVYISNIVILYFFHKYVCAYLFSVEEEKQLKRAGLMNVLCLIALILVIFAAFTNLYYSIDNNNIYHRNQTYIVSLILPLAGMLIELSFLIQYRKRLTRGAFFALASYILLPAIAAVIQLGQFGISIIDVSICISMMIMYVTILGEQNTRIGQLSKKQIETVAELQTSMVLNQCIAELTTEADINTAINNLLAIINNYFGSDRCYIFEIDYKNNLAVNTYEYVKEGISAQKDNLQDVPLQIVDSWMEEFRKDKQYYISDIDDEKGTEVYDILKAQDIERLLEVSLKRDGQIIGFLGVDNPKSHYNDATLLNSIQYFVANSLEKRVQQEELNYLSYKDMLTGIYNRNKYINVLEGAKNTIIKNTGVAYIDLNGLKSINDNYGHASGDKFISSAAHIINNIFPDDCYRIGGDEFVVIKTDINAKAYEDMIVNLKDTLKKNNVSASIGSLYKEEVTDMEELLKSADKIMYKEKEAYHKKKEESKSENR